MVSRDAILWLLYFMVAKDAVPTKIFVARDVVFGC